MTTSLDRTTPTAKVDAIVDTLVLAFSVDPLARWVYPKPQQYLTYFPEFVRLLGRNAFEAGTARSNVGETGAALWLAPGSHPDEMALEAQLQRTVAFADQPAAFALFEQMGRYHPQESHWYLAFLGVDPKHQRQGYGSALMEPVLRECDRDHTLAYLESSSPESVRLYERHGFKPLGTIQVDNSPLIIPMVRHPQLEGKVINSHV